MFSDDNAEKLLKVLANSAPARAPMARRMIRVDDACADIGLSEGEVRRAIDELARDGLVRPAHFDLRTVLVTPQGRMRAERLAEADERRNEGGRGTDTVDSGAIAGGA